MTNSDFAYGVTDTERLRSLYQRHDAENTMRTMVSAPNINRALVRVLADMVEFALGREKQNT